MARTAYPSVTVALNEQRPLVRIANGTGTPPDHASQLPAAAPIRPRNTRLNNHGGTGDGRRESIQRRGRGDCVLTVTPFERRRE
jgi:hypothetical protein